MLRFSDAETSDPENNGTVPLHAQIIEARGAVWWGWWKKTTEPGQESLLAYLRAEARRKQGLRVGLINRKEDVKLYVASCIDVEFGASGSRINSPDESLTPEYYRRDAFPAWFRLTKIDEVERRDFLNEFGEVPSLDPTLYDVRWTDEEWEIYPRPNWSMSPIAIRSPTVLHLSDLHFGADHGFPTERVPPGSGVDQAPLWQLIVNYLTRTRSIQVGLVVVSGDFITRGDANGFPRAAEFLRNLLNALGLDINQLVIVPGNHDLWTEQIEHPTRTYEHQQPYFDFVRSIFGAGFSDRRESGLERVRRYRAPNGDDLVFLELNSARIRSDALKEYGFVSKHRYEELLRFVEDTLENDKIASGRVIRFAVLHHHILPVGGVSIPEKSRPVSLCLDAGELIDNFQAHGVQFVLHGHQHAPFVGMTARVVNADDDKAWRPDNRSVFVLGCGSSGVKRDRLPNDVNGNIFGLYCLNGNNLNVEFIQYLPAVEPRRLWKMALPIYGRRPSRVQRGAVPRRSR